MGFTKFRPLVVNSFNRELAACGGGGRGVVTPWFKQLQQSFNQSLLLDRHLMRDIETNVCVGSLEGEYHSIDSLRLILTQRFKQLNFRELPVSLLRLYFVGQQKFSSILTRLSVDAQSALQHLFQTPDIDGALRRVIDLTFCSFERTLERLIESRDKWDDMFLCHALSHDSYWKGMSLPPLLESNRADHMIWYATVWRMHVTIVLERLVKPWHDDESMKFFLYQSQLYRDTHLDLLSIMVKDGVYRDDALINRHVMRLYYPTSNRVCCIEELPNLSAYAFDNLMTGPDTKTLKTMPKKMSHYTCRKTFNNICKDRNWWEIIRDYGEQHPIIYDHVKQSLRCVLLGNLPNTQCALDVMARIRINISFWPAYADEVLTREEIDATMPVNCNPFILAREKREKKVQKERAKKHTEKKFASVMEAFDAKEAMKMNYEKTRFKMWLIKCRYFASSLMKEILFYTEESSVIIDRYLSLDVKWIQYKNIIRAANGQCRQELSMQAKNRPLDTPFDWSVIEHIEKSPDGRYDIKRGKIMIFHTNTLDVTTKVRKRNFIGIIEVKSTGIEERIDITKYNNLQPIYAAVDTANRTKPTLDELHFLAYCMAIDDNQIIRTSIFKLLGMSAQGLATLREWLFEYYTYDIPDDSLKKKIDKFQRQNIQDYIIMKTVFKLINFYRKRDKIFFLPLPMALRQMNALRTRYMRINDWDATPRQLGLHYQCLGCQKFANTIIHPCDYAHASTYNEFTCSRHRVYAPMQQQQQHNALFYDQKNQHIVEYHSDDGRDDVGATAPPRSDNISYLTMAAYNQIDGKAYCIKNKKKRVPNYNKTASMDEKNIIMQSRNGKMTISCNKVTSTTITSMTATNDDDKTSEAECDDLEGEESITNILLTIDEVSKGGGGARERLKQYAKHLLQSQHHDKPKKKNGVENNKKKILDIILEPLQKLYHCGLPMEERDMVGVVINGKVLCVNCGLMTEYKNFNNSTYGHVCMREESAEMTKNHSLFTTIEPVNEVTTKKRAIHPRLLIINQQQQQQCQICQKTQASIILVVRGEAFKLTPLRCCSVCHNNLTNPKIVKAASPLLSLTEIHQFLKHKHYPSLVIK